MKQKIVGVIVIMLLLSTTIMSGVLLDFVFFYPLFMAFLWIVGGIYFYYHWERYTQPPVLREYPQVSILIPCFNEGENVVETIDAAASQHYPNYEIIAINDGSKDETGAQLDELAKEYPRLRVVHLAQNQGKAMALRMGAMVSNSEYLVCIDGDALLDPDAVSYLVRPLIINPRVGAVTGNPRVRTRSALLGKIQVGEFSSIIGLIKRAQRVYGSIFTVSGVIAAFRRTALHRCGYWSLNMITEDIDISWLLQLDHWSIQYEPAALCWILMPETYGSLWRQRLRWAQGGAEVFLKQIGRIGSWRHHRMWALVIDYCLSVTWAYAFIFSILLWVLGKLLPFPLPQAINVPTLLPPAFWGLLLATVCLTQSIVAIMIETRYEPRLSKILFWVVWYPFVFWLLTMSTALAGFPKALLKHHAKRGLWVSPDRGFKA